MTLFAHLLFVYVLMMSISALVSFVLWRAQRVEHLLRLTQIWASLIVATGIQSVWRGSSLGIVLALACAYPAYFLMGELVADLANIRFRRHVSHYLFAAAIACTLAVSAVGLDFTWVALPVSVLLGYPLVVTSILALKARTTGLPVRMLASINLLAALWGQSFPFLRLDENFAAIGFTGGIMFVFAFAVLAPLAIFEHQRAEFALVASHELKAPLTPLQLIAGVLANLTASDEVRSTPVSTQLWRLAASLNRHVEYLNRLAENLLSASNFQAGFLKLHLEENVDFDVLVADVAERLELLPDETPESSRRIVIKQPALAEPRALGQWDRFKINLVVSNLLANALKYGDGKQVRAEIEYRESDVKFTVRDEGIGIDENSLVQLFTPYKRGTNAKGYPGMGLGLFVSRRIVQIHGGELRCESTLGRGSKFEMVLPLIAPRA